MCINFYYKDNRPCCKVSNDLCDYIKFCQMEYRHILSERALQCPTFNKKIKIPNGAYKVKFIKQGKLFVDIVEKNSTIAINNIYNYEPKFIYLQHIKDLEYKIIDEEEFKNIQVGEKL